MEHLMKHEITYRGWTINRWIQPDGCYYGYAPDYDGADPNQTKLGRSLLMLCDEIDEQIAEWEGIQYTADGKMTAPGWAK
jgi:hypothetical protein